MSIAFSYESLGVTNKIWGVCGFTSAFYAMYKESGKTQAWLQNAVHGYSVLYEIRDYLMLLKSEASPLLQKITDFTRSFGTIHAAFTVDNYIQNIDFASRDLKEDKDILKDPKFGIGMPPEAVADYLAKMWNAKSSVQEVTVDSGADGIIGVCLDNPGMPYKGLVHYMYRRNGKIYSWGDAYASVNEAAQKGVNLPSWAVRWLVPVKV
jgi:hypothetical protein